MSMEFYGISIEIAWTVYGNLWKSIEMLSFS